MKGADLRPNKKKEDLIMNDYERALALRDETVAHRRWMHTHAEVGLEMPKARAYVLEQLKLAGLEPRPCGHGVVAELGKKGGKTLLLRADMDALPMKEESGEPFACPSGTEAHACGHDFHAAMLLSAAKLLKESEDKLEGTVRFMFQPAEETFEGAKDMIANGILDGVDAALAYHVSTGRMPVGIFMYNDSGTMMNSVDGFKITVHGKGSHGAYPQNSIDPINIGVHIYLALDAIIAHEADPHQLAAQQARGPERGGDAESGAEQDELHRLAQRAEGDAVFAIRVAGRGLGWLVLAAGDDRSDRATCERIDLHVRDVPGPDRRDNRPARLRR